MAKPIRTIVAFDFGMKYIGVATGQTVTRQANPLCCIKARNGVPDWAAIEKLISTWQPQMLLVGLPLNMDDSEQHITNCARNFANRLHARVKIPVSLVDERLSTWEAKQDQYTTLEELNANAAAILANQWLADYQD